MQDIIQSRLAALGENIRQLSLDALLVLVGENRRYLSGFTGEESQFDETAGVLLITPTHRVLATDSRYVLQARRQAPLFRIERYDRGFAKALPALLQAVQARRVGFESVRLSVHQLTLIEKELAACAMNVELVPTENLVEPLRAIKTSQEVEATGRALAIAEEAFQQVTAQMKPGMTEKELAWLLESHMRRAGAEAAAFPSIVAAGPNSALPHAVPSDRAVQLGEPVLFDWGARLDGYCSDTSRTVILGPPDERFSTIYATVLKAQQLAIAAIRDGASGQAVDQVAREYIGKAGYQGKFDHSLGHGTGLAVHEAPRLSPSKDETLKSGMIVTVEPGIYLPEWGGVRIENQVVVEPNGARVLNRLDPGRHILETESHAP